jgi:hypothetical protein
VSQDAIAHGVNDDALACEHDTADLALMNDFE